MKTRYDSCETKRCVVLDPFSGAGTVAVVAVRNNLDWVGIDLAPDYIEQAMERIANVQKQFKF